MRRNAGISDSDQVPKFLSECEKYTSSVIPDNNSKGISFNDLKNSNIYNINEGLYLIFKKCGKSLTAKLYKNLKSYFFDLKFETQTKILMIPVMVILCLVIIYNHFTLIENSLINRFIAITYSEYVVKIVFSQEVLKIELEDIKFKNLLDLHFENLIFQKIYFKELIENKNLLIQESVTKVNDDYFLFESIIFENDSLKTTNFNFSLNKKDSDYLNKEENPKIIKTSYNKSVSIYLNNLIKINYLFVPLLFQKHSLLNLISSNTFLIINLLNNGTSKNNISNNNKNTFKYFQSQIQENERYYDYINFKPYNNFMDPVSFLDTENLYVNNNKTNWFSFFNLQFYNSSLNHVVYTSYLDDLHHNNKFTNSFSIFNLKLLNKEYYSENNSNSTNNNDNFEYYINIGLVNTFNKLKQPNDDYLDNLASANNQNIKLKNNTFQFNDERYVVNSDTNVLFYVPQFLNYYFQFGLEPLNGDFMYEGVNLKNLNFDNSSFDFSKYNNDPTNSDFLIFDTISLYNKYIQINNKNKTNDICENFDFFDFYDRLKNSDAYKNCFNSTETNNFIFFANKTFPASLYPNCLCLPLYCFADYKNKNLLMLNFDKDNLNNSLYLNDDYKNAILNKNFHLPGQCKIDLISYDSSINDDYLNMRINFKNGSLSIDNNFTYLNAYFSKSSRSDELYSIVQINFQYQNYVVYIYIICLIGVFTYFIFFIFSKTDKLNNDVDDIFDNNFINLILKKKDKTNKNFNSRRNNLLDFNRRRSHALMARLSIDKRKKAGAIIHGLVNKRNNLKTIHETFKETEKDEEKFQGLNLSISESQLLSNSSSIKLSESSEVIAHKSNNNINSNNNIFNNNSSSFNFSKSNKVNLRSNRNNRRSTKKAIIKLNKTLLLIEKKDTKLNSNLKEKSKKEQKDTELEDIKTLLIHNKEHFLIDLNNENFLVEHEILESYSENVKTLSMINNNCSKGNEKEENFLEEAKNSKALLQELLSCEFIKLDCYFLNFNCKFKINYTMREMYNSESMLFYQENEDFNSDNSNNSEFIESRLNSIMNNMKLIEVETSYDVIGNCFKLISEDENQVVTRQDALTNFKNIKNYTFYYLEMIYLNWLKKIHEKSFFSEFEV